MQGVRALAMESLVRNLGGLYEYGIPLLRLLVDELAAGQCNCITTDITVKSGLSG
jgi:hypothetical protein